jgi:hypothetical protein
MPAPFPGRRFGVPREAQSTTVLALFQSLEPLRWVVTLSPGDPPPICPEWEIRPGS